MSTRIQINFCHEKVSVSDSKLFSQAASKWKIIGTLLKIPSGSLEAIGCDSRGGVEEALSRVFTSWKRHMYSPYSWETVLEVLATDAVGHRRLANDIAHRLSGEKGDCVYFAWLHLPFSMVYSCIAVQCCHCNKIQFFYPKWLNVWGC